MAQYEVMVRLVVNADSDQDAYYACQYAVENMIAGDIVEATVDGAEEIV